jgi:hypothetical protein
LQQADFQIGQMQIGLEAWDNDSDYTAIHVRQECRQSENEDRVPGIPSNRRYRFHSYSCAFAPSGFVIEKAP